MIICPWKEIRRYVGAVPGLEEALSVIEGMKTFEVGTYPLSNGGKVVVGDKAVTRDGEGKDLEAHRNFLDIQYIVKGEEIMGWAPTETLTPADEYNPTKDKQMYSGHVDFMRIAEGYCYVVWPEDAHMPGVYLTEPNAVTKLVVKLKV